MVCRPQAPTVDNADLVLCKDLSVLIFSRRSHTAEDICGIGCIYISRAFIAGEFLRIFLDLYAPTRY